MRPMASARRIAIVLDDKAQRSRFAGRLPPGARIYEASGGDELRRLAAAHAIDLIIAGVLNRNDEFLPSALLELSLRFPEIAIVGVFESSRPSLDEAADLVREIPTMGFVCRPDARFDYLLRPRLSPTSLPTFTPKLLDCMGRLPLFGGARAFAYLQALHPSFSPGIPEQARDLGLSRRNLERWFQGPDICSAGCFQSVCAAAEAAYLRLACGMRERDIASVVGVLTREGMANPMAVPRAIRSALPLGLDELRVGGVGALAEAVDTALRTSRDPTRIPAQWGPGIRYAPQLGVLSVPREGRLVLIDPVRGVEHRLDPFGEDAWPLVMQGLPFAKITADLSSLRREPPHEVRTRLIALLGELLVLRLIRREPGNAEADEA